MAESTRVQEVLAAVLELPAAERTSFLNGACTGEPAVREEVDRLLADGSPTDDFLERPAFAPASPDAEADGPRFDAEQLLAGRFRLERFIGRGGMGEVYEALDLELGTRVALKTLRAGMDSQPGAIEQFRREVLRARSVAHPNVCRVYDLFAHQESDQGTVRFLTMELLKGETLAQVLATAGPFSADRVLYIATQVGSALDEAHRLGIVHRDLKPNNIVLVDASGGCRAVVTDFGLALRLTDRPDGLRSSEPLAGGTEGYMAPEQRTRGVLGAAVDLYAFGVLVHEMLTGTVPDQSLPGGPAVPPSWQAAISACLQTDPSARPRSASEVLRPLHPPPTRTLSRWGVAGVAAVLAVTLYLPFSRILRWTPATRPGAEIVLARFVNDTVEPDLEAVTEVFRQQLKQSPFLNVVETRDVEDTLRRMARPPDTEPTLQISREVAWRRSADLVGSGRIWRVDRGYGLTVRLEERPSRPDSSGRSRSSSFEARDREGLQRAVGLAAAWLRAAAGETSRDITIHDRPVEEVTTSSWQALSLFTRAEGLISQSREEDGLALLAEAARLDPDFALAWMRMGDVLMSRRQYDEAYQKWRQASDVYARRKLSGREDYRIRGMFASDTEDYAEAERVYRLYLVSYPNDPAPYFYIARPLLMLGRVDEAIRMLKEAQRREPRGHRAPAQLAMYCLRAGRLDEAAAQIGTLRRMGQPAWAECIEGAYDFLNGRYDSALHRFEGLERVDDRFLRTRAPALQAAVLAERGRHPEAVVRLRRGLAADLDAGNPAAAADKLLGLAHLLLRAGEHGGCRDACIRALQLDGAAQRVIQGAALLARAGDPEQAERWLAQLERSAFARDARVGAHRVRGEIFLARHEPLKAWTEFQQATRLEAPGVLCEYLARGASAAGEQGLALTLYERIASDPGYYWRYPDSDPPGTWSDGLAEYLRLAERQRNHADISVAQQRYRALRPAAVPADAITETEVRR